MISDFARSYIFVTFLLHQQTFFMRKLLSLLLIAVFSFFVSCTSDAGGMSATAKKNIEINEAITKAYEAGEFDKMGDYIAADAIDHSGEQGDIVGLENIVAEMKKWKDNDAGYERNYYSKHWRMMSMFLPGQNLPEQ